ncbi:thioesterase family protein [Actinoplanes sp. LDG1-06]|uniref:Thioesterase family protein n=1 Tax=Paractinoplanes ovalisporus TaxID=2810368 RepID=A0ABS2APG5_9ACTN|nr:thioesterase family protein [Actinoplanes ovalisporus]MBM2621742.1 thioesterase family protein [Actinoplanes ovalisporus]
MSFYLPLGDDEFRPTRSTESPWDTEMQHGGPPAALLGRVLTVEGLRLARISVDFLGPIPRRDFRVEVSPIKPGRLTALNEARMLVDGRVAVTARAWHLAPGPKPPVGTPTEQAAPLPEDESKFPGMEDWGYGQSIEWRVTKGALGEPGETHVWSRVRMPLIDGHELDGQDRALIVADSANGLSAVLPMDRWLSIPPTMTTTLLRPATGDWVHLAARTILSDDGLGLTSGDLHDPDGAIGQVSQPLVVRAR